VIVTEEAFYQEVYIQKVSSDDKGQHKYNKIYGNFSLPWKKKDPFKAHMFILVASCTM